MLAVVALAAGVVLGIALADRGIDRRRAARALDDLARFASQVPDPHASAIATLVAELAHVVGVERTS